MEFSMWLNMIIGAAFIQGCFLVFLFQKKKSRHFKYLRWLLIVINLTLVTRLFVFNYNSSLPHLTYLPDIAIFLFTPLLWFHIRWSMGKHLQELRWLLLAQVAHLIILIPILYKSSDALHNLITSQSEWVWLTWKGIEGAGILFNLIILILISRELRRSNKERITQRTIDANTKHLAAYVILFLAFVLIWGASYCLSLFIDTQSFYQVAWIMISVIVYVLSYHTINSNHKEVEIEFEPNPKYAQSQIDSQQVPIFLEKLETYMESNKPYLKSGLSLDQLSQSLDLNPHIVSRTINEGTGMNFYEYVNQFRIQEFLDRVQKPTNKHLTLLAVAQSVGFNTKVTFNKAFKRHLGTTPSQYLRQKYPKE